MNNIYNLNVAFKFEKVAAICGLTYLAAHGNMSWFGLLLVWFGFWVWLVPDTRPKQSDPLLKK